MKRCEKCCGIYRSHRSISIDDSNRAFRDLRTAVAANCLRAEGRHRDSRVRSLTGRCVERRDGELNDQQEPECSD